MGYFFAENYMLPRHDLPDEGRGSVPHTQQIRHPNMDATQPGITNLTFGPLQAACPPVLQVTSEEPGDRLPDGVTSLGGRPLSEMPPEEMIDVITEMHDSLLDIEYGAHLLVLTAVAILNECGKREAVKTGSIDKLANRLTTRDRERHSIEYSLNTLYDNEYIGRDHSSPGNAYHWWVTERGERLLLLQRELGIIEKCADSPITADL